MHMAIHVNLFLDIAICRDYVCGNSNITQGPDTMIIHTNTKRICAGEYEVSSPQRPGKTVRLTKVWYPNDGEYWIAAPSFDSNTSDPVYTKRDAVKSAENMLRMYRLNAALANDPCTR